MKLTLGHSNDHVVGEIFLNNEVSNLLKQGYRLELGCVLVQMDHGREIISLTLIPIPTERA